MKVVLVSTYELGRQPFGLASPAAWLREYGHHVTCADLSLGVLPSLEVRDADLIAFHLPMHTATRLAVPAIERVRHLNPSAHLCCYGLYAPLNEEYLRSLGVRTILGGEFEASLAALAGGSDAPSSVSMERLSFRTPDRTGLPVLSRYPKLVYGAEKRRVGYTEASRGCKHRCRHCPVVPVYDGAFRIVQPDVVLEDIRRQVAAGAEHISFGDPDFLNGPAHARRIVEALHREFPELSYDITAKVEHLLAHSDLLPVLRETGCLFVISAVESLEEVVLARFDKGHTREDFIRMAELLQREALTLSPTFIPFTPWTTLPGYRDLLATIESLGLVGHVAPVQLTLRLLVTSGSRLLELDDIKNVVDRYDPAALAWRWHHPDPEIDRLARDVLAIVHHGTKRRQSRHDIFARLWERAFDAPPSPHFHLVARTTIPYMEEPWFC